MSDSKYRIAQVNSNTQFVDISRNVLLLEISLDMKVKMFCLLWGLSLLCIKGYAQSADSLIRRFHKSIQNNVHYSDTLEIDCVSTYTILKAEVTEAGEVVNLMLSDSADPRFNLAFITQLSKFDVAALKAYAKMKKLKNIVLLMPISYSVITGSCRPFLLTSAVDNSFFFNKEEFRSQAVILPTLVAHRTIERIE